MYDKLVWKKFMKSRRIFKKDNGSLNFELPCASNLNALKEPTLARHKTLSIGMDRQKRKNLNSSIILQQSTNDKNYLERKII